MTTVLLLDDHDIVLEGLQRALGRSGFDVVAVTTDPDAAVTLARRESPDLCLIDLRLRDRLGTEVIPALLAAHPGTRVVMLTSFDDGKAARDALAAGAAGFLLKDTSSDELSRQLHSIAGGATVIDDRVSEAVFRPPVARLSDRQVSILRLVATGATNAEVARELHLSPHTVKDHLAQIMRSLDARTRAEAVARGIAEGLLAPESSA